MASTDSQVKNRLHDFKNKGKDQDVSIKYCDVGVLCAGDLRRISVDGDLWNPRHVAVCGMCIAQRCGIFVGRRAQRGRDSPRSPSLNIQYFQIRLIGCGHCG